MFEGLGLGSRLSSLPLPHRFAWGTRLLPLLLHFRLLTLAHPVPAAHSTVPYTASCIYAAITPLGVAIGLGVRTTYNPDSANALIVSGVLDALSAGVLLYTGLVELLAHDFLFNRESESSFLPLRGGCSALSA